MKIILLFALTLLCALTSFSQQDDDKYLTSSEVDQKVKLISPPLARANKNCREDSGSIDLKVYFHKSEIISKVEVFRPSTCSDFDQASIEAAKKIKFKAAVKDGQTVSYVTSVIYKWQRL